MVVIKNKRRNASRANSKAAHDRVTTDITIGLEVAGIPWRFDFLCFPAFAQSSPTSRRYLPQECRALSTTPTRPAAPSRLCSRTTSLRALSSRSVTSRKCMSPVQRTAITPSSASTISSGKGSFHLYCISGNMRSII